VNAMAGKEASAPVTGFVIRAADATKSALSVTCECPKDESRIAQWNFVLVPVLDANRTKIERYEVVTWEPREGKAPAGPKFADVASVKRERIETTYAFTLRPLYHEGEGMRHVTGFELASVAGNPRGKEEELTRTKSEAGSDPAEANEPERIQVSKATILLPTDAKAGTAFGLRISPSWKDKGITGFGIALAYREAEPIGETAGGSQPGNR